MKKKFILISILALCTSSIFALDMGMKVDINALYHPSITLDDSTDLPLYSSLATSFDFSPVAFNIEEHQFGPIVSLLYVTRSLVYNNEVMRGFSAIGFGFEYGYYFNSTFKLNTKLGMGVGRLGPSRNLELYANVSVNPSFVLIKKDGYDVCITIPVNIIYRKYLLSPSIGVGVSTSFDWLSNQFIKSSSN